MAEKDKEMVDIQLNGVGVTYKSSIHPALAAVILNLCLSGTGEKEMAAGAPAPSVLIGAGKTSLGEYVGKYNPTSYPEKILAIAAYLKEIKERETFSPEDIRPLFRTIGDMPPANFGRDFRLAVSNTWIAPEDQDPNTYYVTNPGMTALKSSFSGEVAKRKRAKKRRKGANDKKDGA